LSTELLPYKEIKFPVIKLFMLNSIPQNQEVKTKTPSKASEISFFIDQLRNGVWLFGIPSWVFGISDRTFAALADGSVSGGEVIQLFTASVFFLSWVCLKPQESYSEETILASDEDDFLSDLTCRPDELKRRHMISQEYILPFPYICQIYHLLNLKHLESVHNFSLNNLKVLGVQRVEATSIGGKITFQTMLDSPINPLRIWRDPIVEVDLILHNPYTVELSIPVYNGKRIVVIFIALPLRDNEHKFFIDIYSDLGWPKPILQVILHFAACLTLFEDLSYYRALASKSAERLLSINSSGNNQSMWLYKRFVELYGSTVETPKLMPEMNNVET
jgi:hypothetical protein